MSLTTYELHEIPCKRKGLRQTAIKSKDGLWYVVSSQSDMSKTKVIDMFMFGQSFESKTMIFHGYKDGISQYADLWATRPMNHDEGIKRAIEGDFE